MQFDTIANNKCAAFVPQHDGMTPVNDYIQAAKTYLEEAHKHVTVIDLSEIVRISDLLLTVSYNIEELGFNAWEIEDVVNDEDITEETLSDIILSKAVNFIGQICEKNDIYLLFKNAEKLFGLNKNLRKSNKMRHSLIASLVRTNVRAWYFFQTSYHGNMFSQEEEPHVNRYIMPKLQPKDVELLKVLHLLNDDYATAYLFYLEFKRTKLASLTNFLMYISRILDKHHEQFLSILPSMDIAVIKEIALNKGKGIYTKDKQKEFGIPSRQGVNQRITRLKHQGIIYYDSEKEELKISDGFLYLYLHRKFANTHSLPL